MGMQRKNIIVISDDLNTGRSVAFILEAAQFEISLVSRLKEFAEVMSRSQQSENPPAVLVIDLEMPGITEAGWLSAFDQFKDQVPILAINGYPLNGNPLAKRFRKLDGYLEKPFDARLLLSQIRRLTANGKRRRNSRSANPV